MATSPLSARSRTALEAISTVTVLLMVARWAVASEGSGSVRIFREETFARWYAVTVFVPRNLWEIAMVIE